MLLAPPLCGVFGVANALAMLAAARPFAMMPAWDARLAAELIERHQVTHMNATDEAVAQLLDLTQRTPAYPTLRFVGYAAFNPAMADMVERAQARGLTLVGLYGISEIQALFSRQPETATLQERRLGGGRPVSALARVRARDPDTGQVLAHGQSGELEFLAPSSRMVEYFGDPQATAQALLEGGWYRSGDLGYTLEDGRFVFLTRMGDSLRLGGFLVSPAEIEECAQQFEGIDGCQVVGVKTGGALRPLAFVTLEPGARLDEAGLIAHAARLARYKVPVRLRDRCFPSPKAPTQPRSRNTGCATWRKSAWMPARPDPWSYRMNTIETIEARLAGLFSSLIGLKLTEAQPDRVVAQMLVRPDLCTAGGILHGGAIMAFADTLGAVGTVLNMPADAGTATIESKTNFFRPALTGTTVTGTTTPVNRGKRTQTWETRITTEDGKLVALVTQTQMVF
jgi:uncharacterized protein (TIGR00369 family)